MKSKPFKIADHLDDDETISGYLTEALSNENPAGIIRALGDVARARGGMTELARETGLSRESLYRALSDTGNPELGTILKVLRALNIKLTASIDPAEAA